MMEATIQWFLNSTELTSNSSEFGGSIIDSGNFTLVEIDSLSLGNEGTYTCRAINSLGSDVTSYTVMLGMLPITITIVRISGGVQTSIITILFVCIPSFMQLSNIVKLKILQI